MEHLVKMDDLGVPLLQETSKKQPNFLGIPKIAKVYRCSAKPFAWRKRSLASQVKRGAF
jgi:hypothetical protein